MWKNLVRLLKSGKGDKVLNIEERVFVLKTQIVLNGKVFNFDILDKPCIRAFIDCEASHEEEHLFECYVHFCMNLRLVSFIQSIVE